MRTTFDPRLLLVLGSGALGGVIAHFIGAPMPFLLGGIFGSAGFVLSYEREGRELPQLSRWVRFIGASLIGAMIGSRFSPELTTLLPQFWPSVIVIVLFILTAHAGNYAIMRGLGRYEKKDAYFAGLPGGIVDSVLLAEKAGANIAVVTAQHFIRIIMVVTAVPLLFLVIEGHAVGSIAGETLADGKDDFSDLVLIALVAGTGLFIGRLLKLPVSHLMGPLLLALTLSVTGVIEIHIPPWLQHLGQYMLAVSLGAQFSGISRKLLARSLGMGLLSGTWMLGLAALIATVLRNYVPADFEVLFISFAAGGLAEMSLIALSLNFTPVVVALHHLVRIFLTIWIGMTLWRFVGDKTDQT